MSNIANGLYPFSSFNNSMFIYKLQTQDLIKKLGSDYAQLAEVIGAIYLKTNKPLTNMQVFIMGKIVATKCMINSVWSNDVQTLEKAETLRPFCEKSIRERFTDAGCIPKMIQESVFGCVKASKFVYCVRGSYCPILTPYAIDEF